MRPKVKLLLLFAIATLTLGLTVYGLMQSSVRIEGRGTVKVVNIAVFWDSNCTQKVLAIDWGIVEPGSANNKTIYVRNEANVNATLFMYTENWNPANASNYIDLTWDYDGTPLEPSQVAQVTLTLTVSPDVKGITSFSFDMIIGVSG